jgi:hypothetical protein
MIILGVLNILWGLTFEMFDLNHSFIILSIIPLISYNNADVEKIRILKENKDKSGIYC